MEEQPSGGLNMGVHDFDRKGDRKWLLSSEVLTPAEIKRVIIKRLE